MVLPLIPLAVAGAAGAGLLGGGAALSSFFAAQDSKNEAEKTASILNTPDLTENQVAGLAAQAGVNPHSKFQKPGDGWFSDYSQVDSSSQTTTNTITDNRQFTYTYTIESPGATVTTSQENAAQTTQKPEVTHSSTHEASAGVFDGLGSVLSGMGSSLLTVGILAVGGFALYKLVTGSGAKGDAV